MAAIPDPVVGGVEELPGEVLAQVFGLLAPRELADVESVSRRCRSIVLQQELWRRHCARAHPAMPAATAAIDASRVPSHRPTAASGAGTAAAGTAEQPRPPQLGARLQRLAQLQQRLADEQQQAQHLSQQQRQELAEVQQQAAEERRLAEIQEQEHQALQEQFADEQLLLELQQHLAEPQEHAQLGEQLQRLATTQQQLAEVRRQLALGSRPAETQQQQQQEQQQQQQQLQLASAFFKRLHCSLTAPPAKESLVAEALAASSTDQPQEDVHNVLTPTSRSRDRMCYWSSRGSEDKSGCEALALRLAHPLCLVTEVQLRPFRAWFQWGAPVYSPRAVRFRIGGLPCFARGGALLDGSPALAAALEVAVGRDLHQAVAAAQVQERQWVARAQQLERRVLQRMDEGRGQAQPGDAQVQKHAMQQLLLSLQHAAAQQPDEPGPQRALEAMMVLLGDEREAAVQAARGHPHEQPAADGSWEWTSQIYYVAESDTLQRFQLPHPILCVGGYLRIELLGKTERQAADDAFYTCICHARVTGTPIRNFVLLPEAAAAAQGAGAASGSSGAAPGRVWRLTYLEPDPLQAAGGLRAVSEGGRLAALGDGSGEEEGDEEEGSDDDDSVGGEYVQGDPGDEEGEGEGSSSGSDSGTDDDEWQPGGDAGAY